MRELEAAGDLTLRAVVPLWQKPETSFDEMRDQLRLRGEHGRLWRGGVAKFFIDGVIDTGTGVAVRAGHARRRARAVLARSRSATPRRCGCSPRPGSSASTHATGERGVGAALDAYFAAGAADGVRHRIEHIETVTDADLARFPREDVVASMQPLHMQWRQDDDRTPGPRASARAGGPRLADGDLAASRRLAGARLGLAGGAERSPHRDGVGAAAAGRRGRPAGATFEPDQCLSGLEALRGYTTGAAATVGEVALGGRIAPGLRADLTIFADDPVVVARRRPARPAGARDHRRRRDRPLRRRLIRTAILRECDRRPSSRPRRPAST